MKSKPFIHSWGEWPYYYHNMRKVKIVYVVPSLIQCGPINVLYNIVRHLDFEVFDCVVVELSRHRTDAVRGNADKFRQLGVEVVRLNKPKWRLSLNKKRLAQELNQQFEGANVVFHAHGYYPALILSKMKEHNTVVTVHNICDEDFKNSYGRLMGSLMARQYKRALCHLSCCVTICQAMQQYYAKQLPKATFTTIYNGVDFKDTECVDLDLLRAQLQIKKDTKVFLYPAVISKIKNQIQLIEELKHSALKDVVVLFVGETNDKTLLKRCKDAAAGDVRFRFIGYQMNMSPYWQLCDYMVSSSVSEGLPMAVLEAVLRGKPCLLSNIPPHCEIAARVFDAPQLHLFDLRHQGELAAKIEQLCSSTTSFNKELIKKRAAAYFSSQQMSEGYQQLYRRLLQR